MSLLLLLVDDLQMSCYRIMCSIYSSGTVKTPHAERFVCVCVCVCVCLCVCMWCDCVWGFYIVVLLYIYIRHRPALGECLAHLAAAMPVAYLEPHLNEYNAFSVYTTKTPRERSSKSSLCSYTRWLNTFIILQNIYILNKCYSFERYSSFWKYIYI